MPWLRVGVCVCASCVLCLVSVVRWKMRGTLWVASGGARRMAGGVSCLVNDVVGLVHYLPCGVWWVACGVVAAARVAAYKNDELSYTRLPRHRSVFFVWRPTSVIPSYDMESFCTGGHLASLW